MWQVAATLFQIKSTVFCHFPFSFLFNNAGLPDSTSSYSSLISIFICQQSLVASVVGVFIAMCDYREAKQTLTFAVPIWLIKNLRQTERVFCRPPHLLTAIAGNGKQNHNQLIRHRIAVELS